MLFLAKMGVVFITRTTAAGSFTCSVIVLYLFNNCEVYYNAGARSPKIYFKFYLKIIVTFL